MEPDSIGVIATTTSLATAFRIGTTGKPMTVVEVNLERKGKFAKGHVICEKALRADPKRSLESALDRLTSLEEHITASKLHAVDASNGGTMTDAGKIDEPDADDLCPNGEPEEQAIWYIEHYLTRSPDANLKKVLFYLARQGFRGHSEQFVYAHFDVKESTGGKVVGHKLAEKNSTPAPTLAVQTLPDAPLSFADMMELAKSNPEVGKVMTTMMISGQQDGSEQAVRNLIAGKASPSVLQPEYPPITRGWDEQAKQSRRHLRAEASRACKRRLEEQAVEKLFHPSHKTYKKSKDTTLLCDALADQDPSLQAVIRQTIRINRIVSMCFVRVCHCVEEVNNVAAAPPEGPKPAIEDVGPKHASGKRMTATIYNKNAGSQFREEAASNMHST